jgi:hypothetical protein
VLAAIERVPTDAGDVPLEDVVIQVCGVWVRAVGVGWVGGWGAMRANEVNSELVLLK